MDDWEMETRCDWSRDTRRRWVREVVQVKMNCVNILLVSQCSQ
jgi:hypothetical protein